MMSRVVLVSAAGSGIGEATARRFAAAGDRVVVTDIDLDAATAVAREIGDSAHAVALDASDADQWAQAVAEAERFADGPVQVLVNNAGILRNVSIEDIDLDLWRRILDVNLTGTLLGMRAVLPGMRSAGGGVIVNTGSTAGLAGFVGLSAYSSTKWALRGLTRSAALEFAHDNVRVNMVVPGVVETPASRAAGYPTYLPGQPIPQVAQPADIANVTFYLASPESSYVTGAEYVADGGRTVGLLK
jgi:3alpha(or 20beta)-hydroxysteroid dehydrogenase